MEAEARMLAVQKEAAALETEQAAYGACDPVVVEQKQRAVLLTHEAAVRWTGTQNIISFYVCVHSLP